MVYCTSILWNTCIAVNLDLNVNAADAKYMNGNYGDDCNDSGWWIDE